MGRDSVDLDDAAWDGSNPESGQTSFVFVPELIFLFFDSEQRPARTAATIISDCKHTLAAIVFRDSFLVKPGPVPVWNPEVVIQPTASLIIPRRQQICPRFQTRTDNRCRIGSQDRQMSCISGQYLHRRVMTVRWIRFEFSAIEGNRFIDTSVVLARRWIPSLHGRIR